MSKLTVTKDSTEFCQIKFVKGKQQN